MLQPVVLSIGAAFVALSSDVDLVTDLQLIAWKKSLSAEETEETEETEEKPSFGEGPPQILSDEEAKELKDKLLKEWKEPPIMKD